MLSFVICNAKHTYLVMPTAAMIPLQYHAQLIHRSVLGNCEGSKLNTLNIRETASICISNKAFRNSLAMLFWLGLTMNSQPT